VAVDHERIKHLLGEKEESADTSLQAKTLQRALGNKPPRTLTPYEWQQWYAEHGIPASHTSGRGKPPWWKGLLHLVRHFSKGRS
jgi:hypothetical protein